MDHTGQTIIYGYSIFLLTYQIPLLITFVIPVLFEENFYKLTPSLHQSLKGPSQMYHPQVISADSTSAKIGYLTKSISYLLDKANKNNTVFSSNTNCKQSYNHVIQFNSFDCRIYLSYHCKYPAVIHLHRIPFQSITFLS